MLSCLYYPYSRPRKAETVKRALLLFDSVAFLDSQPDFIRRALTLRETSDTTGQADIVDAMIAYGETEGVVKVVNTADIVRRHGSIITAATVADVNDDRFAAVALRGGSGIWSFLAERLPKDFLQAFYAGNGAFMESVTLQDIAGEADTDPSLQHFRSFRWGNIDPETAWKRLHGSRLVVGGNPFICLPSYKIPFLAASSLRINEALLVAAAENYVPFTDSLVHDRLLRVKAVTARGEVEQPHNLGIADLANESSDVASLSWRILDKLITPEQLESYSLEDILLYRKKNDRSLSRLRRSVTSLSEELAAVDNLRKLEKSLEGLVDKKVIAEVEAAQAEMAGNWQNFIGAAALRATRGIVPSVAVSILAGLDLTQMLIYAAGAGAIAWGNDGVKDAIELLKSNRKARQSNYSYLTDFVN